MVIRAVVVTALALLITAPPRADAPAPRPTPAEPGLPAALAAALPDGIETGLLAVDARTGRVLATHGADRAVVPASVAKLWTTACSLRELGPAHRFETDARAASGPRPDGAIAGPVFIVGGGNPQFRFEDAWSMARGLVARGVRRIEGGLVGDDSVHEPAGRPAAWPPSSRSDPFHASQSGLALAWNSVEVVVRPGARSGAAAAVDVFPVDAPIRIENRVRTGAATRVETRIRESEEGRAILDVSGTIRAGAEPDRSWVRMGHPSLALLETLDAMLRDAGVSIGKPPRLGTVTGDTVLLHRHESRSLSMLVADVNKFSSNFGAEILLRSLGRFPGRPGGTASGLARLERCLDALEIPRRGVVLADGSGYARGNRITSRALVALLRAARRHPQWGPEFIASLPRAGEDGSLAGRLQQLAGRLRAKTGSLTGVRSLAGYFWTKSGDPIVFSVILNGSGKSAGRVSTAAIDRVVLAMLDELDHPQGRTATRP